MQLIKEIHNLGKKVGIVFCSPWMEDTTAAEACREMFSSQPFDPYVIGRTNCMPRLDKIIKQIEDPVLKNQFNALSTDRAHQCLEWIKSHEVPYFCRFAESDRRDFPVDKMVEVPEPFNNKCKDEALEKIRVQLSL